MPSWFFYQLCALLVEAFVLPAAVNFLDGWRMLEGEALFSYGAFVFSVHHAKRSSVLETRETWYSEIKEVHF